MIKDNGLDIHLSNDMIGQIKRRGHAISGTEIKNTVIKWQGLINEGERELAEVLRDHEIEEAARIITMQAKIDKLNHKEFWGMNAERLGEIVRMYKENIGDRIVRLGELAALALKERVGGVIVFPPGTGGRPKHS